MRMQRVALFAVRKSVQHYVRTDDGVAGGRTIEMGLKFCQATTESSGTNSSVVGVDRAPSKEYRPSAARMHRCSHYLGVIFLPTVVVLGFMYCGCREYAEVFRGSQYCGYFADPSSILGLSTRSTAILSICAGFEVYSDHLYTVAINVYPIFLLKTSTDSPIKGSWSVLLSGRAAEV